MGAVESELGQVMLVYTVLFLFSAKTLNCCDLMLLLLVLEFMQVCVFVYRYSELDDSDDQHKNVDGSATMVFQVVVASVELEKLAYREESVATAWM